MTFCPSRYLSRYVIRVSIRIFLSKRVHRAANTRRAAVEDMRLDHRCLDILAAVIAGTKCLPACESATSAGSVTPLRRSSQKNRELYSRYRYLDFPRSAVRPSSLRLSLAQNGKTSRWESPTPFSINSNAQVERCTRFFFSRRRFSLEA